MERPERPSRHKSSSRMRHHNRRYVFADTNSVVEPDRALPSQPLSLQHHVDNARELLNLARRRTLPSQSGQFTLRNLDSLMPSHNASGSAVDSSTERSVPFRSSGIVAQNNNMCFLPTGIGLLKRYRLISGQGISSDNIDGPSTSRLSDVTGMNTNTEQPNSSISETEIGMLVTDNEGEPPVEPSNQYNSSPPYRELQNQEESEFLRRLDEITFENCAGPSRVRLPARRRLVRVPGPYEPLDQDARSGQESSGPVPIIQNISTLREGAYTPLNGHYSLNIEGDESSRDAENNVHNVEAPEAPESGRQSGDIIILSTPEQQSPPSHVPLLPASPQPLPQSPVDQSPLLPSNEQYPSSQSPLHRSSQPAVTLGERCPPTQSPTHQMMTPSEQYTSVTQSQRTVPVTSVQQCLPVNSGSNSYSTSSSGTPEQKDELKDGSINIYKELNHNLVSILECPVCLDFMVPPIYQCSKGHIVCMTCRPKLILCPTCRARFADRNLAMEKVAERLMYPCKNVVTGCAVTLHLKDKTAHEESCGFRHYLCISPHCQWKGYKPELVVHMMVSHSDKLIVGINQVVSVPLCPIGGHFNWILSALNEVFQVSFLTDISEKLLVGTVYYVGPPEKATKFYYTFCIKHHMDPYNSIEYTHRTHVDTLKASSLISSHDCFNITLDVARTYRASRSSNLLPIVVSVHETP